MKARSALARTSPSARQSGDLAVPFLQRKCGCGSPTASLDGECDECRKRKLQKHSLTVNTPGDRFEQEADRVADAVIAGQPAPVAISPLSFSSIQREEPAREKTDKEKYQEGAKKIGEAFLETPFGKQLTEKVRQDKLVKGTTDFLGTLPGMIVTGAAATGAVSALAAAHQELPAQIPEIPLNVITPGLSVKITYNGPVDTPTDASISFKFTGQAPKAAGGDKPAMTESEKFRAETARIAADQAKFRANMKFAPGSPEALRQEAEDRAMQAALAKVAPGPDLTGMFKQYPGLAPPAPKSGLQLTPPEFKSGYQPPPLFGNQFRFRPLSEPQSAEPKKKDETPAVQRKASSDATADAVPPSVQRTISSPGKPLESATRQFMESRFGHDFTQVRIHDDAESAASVRAVNATAYTIGKDIVFGTSQYTPDTHEGRRLLAHELTHVVQQSGQTSANKPSQSGYPHVNHRRTDSAEQPILQREFKDRCSGSNVTCSGTDQCAKPDKDPAGKDAAQPSAWSLTVNVDIERSSWEDALRTQEFGHTYVQFWENSGKQYTFGFYPAKDLPNESRRVVPGCVHHPDTTHNACVDDKVAYSLTQPQYNAALNLAQKVCRERHDYGPNYTCTTYADEIVKSAGQTIPSSQSAPTTVFHQQVPKIDNPNTLHENIQQELQKDPKKKGFWNNSAPPVLRLRQVDPVKLDDDPDSTAFELVWMPVGGATYRWRLFDSHTKHYLMRGANGSKDILDWLSFTANDKAIIGRKTRDLLKQRGVSQGSVQCTVRHSAWQDQVVTVPVSFIL